MKIKMWPQKKFVKTGHLYIIAFIYILKLDNSCSVYTLWKTQLSKQKYNPNAENCYAVLGWYTELFYTLINGHVKFAFLFLQSDFGVNKIQP